MTSVDDAAGDLFGSVRGGRERATMRLAEGVLHVDYGDEDAVFLVRVQRVPRVRLPAC